MGRVGKAPPKTTKRKKKDKDAPKRPTTAFFYFTKHCREGNVIKLSNDDKNKVSAFTKKCGEMWRNMDEDERTKFNTQATEDRKRYDTEMAIYKPTAVKDPGKPKRSMTAFLLYVNSVRPELKLKYDNKKILVQAANMWKGLDESEKEPFTTQAAEEKRKYQEALEKWQKEQGSNPAKKARKVAPAKNGAEESSGEDEEEEDEEEEEEDESEEESD